MAGQVWPASRTNAVAAMTLDIQHLDDDCYRVCLTEDGITNCTVVSSMHLVEEKAKQLRAANAREAAAAYDLPA